MVVGTHDGIFHADDVMATAILKMYKYGNIQVIRSRESEVLAGCNIVYDVGGGQFDHHGKALKMRASGIPYASAGLIWDYVGTQLIHQYSVGLPKQQVEYIKQKIDNMVMVEIDLVDNGVTTTNPVAKIQGEEIKYTSNTLSSIIKYLNSPTPELQDAAFTAAVDNVAIPYLGSAIRKEITKLGVREKVQSALWYAENGNVELAKLHGSNHEAFKHILNLGHTESDWQEAVLELDKNKEIKFVIYFSDSSKQWRIQSIPVSPGSFKCRKYLPALWAAASPEALNRIIGIQDAIFCHANTFVAGAMSVESILKMAIQAYMYKRAKSK